MLHYKFFFKKMSLLNLKTFLLPKRIVKTPRFFSTAVSTEDEYTSTPQYPPILDLSLKKRKERKKESEYDELKAVKTIEEKQIKLNMPRFYGFKSHMQHEDNIPYDNLNLAKYITRTHLTVRNELPQYFSNVQNDEGVMNSLKSDIEEALLIELDGVRRDKNLEKSEMENILTTIITRQINRIVINNTAQNLKHIKKSEVDWDPRIESSWYVGGIIPPKNIRSYRRNREFLKEFENDPVDRLFYYNGSPTVTVRSELPLRPIVQHSESENPDLNIPEFTYDPVSAGVFTEHLHMANVPGFWPGDPYSFSLLSYHKRGHIINHLERYKDPQDSKEALHRQGILASFGWLHSLANFLGFTTYNDITYPLITQTVITNGQLWSFYIYQLNTILLHSENAKENPKRNLCWATEELKLFEEIVDGKIIGFNEDVLKMLVKLYANVPEDRLGVNLRPYLSQQEKVIADYEDAEKREWLEREYKYLVSNRPRVKLEYEIYNWEKIYKIDHNTRFMEKRLRPFELFKNPFKRTLDERKPRYIPRALRPDLPRYKGRDAKEFFP